MKKGNVVYKILINKAGALLLTKRSETLRLAGGNSSVSAGRTSDKITHAEIYAHGITGSIEFGYNTTNAATYRLDASNVGDMNSAAFSAGALVTSYACRTGLGNTNINEFAFPFESLKLNESLAAKIANTLGVTVDAMATRTNYSWTLGTWYERHLFTNLLPKQVNVDGAILTPNGANLSPIEATTPIGVPCGFFRFTPKN